MNKEEKRKEHKSLVVKHNDLLRNTRYSLSGLEQRILIYLISKVQPGDTEFRKIQFSISEFCEIANIKRSGESYDRLRATIKSLSDKSWWIQVGNKERLFRWIYGEPQLETGIMDLELSPTLEPYLLDLKENFTKYELINVLTLKSGHSIRLYELFKSYLWQGSWTVEVEELKEMLNLKDNYKEFRRFNDKVLKTALEELNDYTDIKVNMEKIKRGKNVIKIKFIIKEKENVDEVIKAFRNKENRLW